MAARYWVGGLGNWDATAGTKWSDVSGGAGGFSVPTLADDVFIDGAVPGNVSVTAVANCRSLNFTGFTNSFIQGTAVNIGDGTAGAGNIALKMVPGMTFTPAGNNMNFSSTAATPQTIDFAGKSSGAVFFTGATGSWQYVGPHVTTGTVTLTRGSLDINGQTCSWGSFNSNNTNVRSFTLGAATLTLTGAGSVWLVENSPNMTTFANLATINLTGSAAAIWHGTSSGPGCAFGTVNYTGGGAMEWRNWGTGGLAANLTVTGTAVKTCTWSNYAGCTVTGTLTINGNSTVNRVLVRTNTFGYRYTLWAGATSFSNVDFQDQNALGAGNWDLSAITGGSGDCGGNLGITFTPSATQTRIASSQPWSFAPNWSGRVPLPQDDVNFNAVSGTVTADMPRLGRNIDFTNFSGQLNHAIVLSSYGSVTMSPTMTIASSSSWQYETTGSCTITSNGKAIAGVGNMMPRSGTLSLGDAYSCGTTFALQGLSTGSFNSQGFPITCATYSHGSQMASVEMSTSTITMNGTTSFVFLMGNGGFHANYGNCHLVIATASGLQRNIRVGTGASGTSNRVASVTYTVADSPGALNFQNAAAQPVYITTLNIGPGRTFYSAHNETLNVTNWNVSGSPTPGNGLVLPGSVAGEYALSSAVLMSGDFDIRCIATSPIWNTTTSKAIANAQSGAWNMYISSSGQPVLTIGGKTFTGVVAPNGSIRATVDTNDGAGNTVCKFWTSPDGGLSWTQLGTTLTSAGTIVLNTTSAIGCGMQASGYNFKGNIYRIQIRDNILDNGTGIVFDADFTTKAFGADSFIESSVNAATVTLNGDCALAGDGRVAIKSITAGSRATINKTSGVVISDYLVIKDSQAQGGATFYAGSHSVSVSNNVGWIFTDPPAIYPQTVVVL